jgi:hypothetical protein
VTLRAFFPSFVGANTVLIKLAGKVKIDSSPEAKDDMLLAMLVAKLLRDDWKVLTIEA